jgi:hypothetical protein
MSKIQFYCKSVHLIANRKTKVQLFRYCIQKAKYISWPKQVVRYNEESAFQ